MRRLHAATAWLCFAMTALVAAVVLFVYGTTSFYLKGYTGEFPLSNPLLLLMAAAAFALLLVPVWRLRKGIAALGWRLPLALSVLLFAAQVFITYHAYFFSVWDARYVLEGARAFAYDMPDAISVSYFSRCPNNLALVGIYGSLLRLPMCLGMELGEERGLLLLILVQCALNTACGLLLWSLTRRVAEAFSDGVTAAQAALVALIAYAVLIGLSPWFLVPYSDSSALIFPVLLLWLYERLKGRLPSALLLGALGALAFMVKPQASIPLIAIGLCELATLIVRRAKRSAAIWHCWQCHLCSYTRRRSGWSSAGWALRSIRMGRWVLRTTSTWASTRSTTAHFTHRIRTRRSLFRQRSARPGACAPRGRG